MDFEALQAKANEMFQLTGPRIVSSDEDYCLFLGTVTYTKKPNPVRFEPSIILGPDDERTDDCYTETYDLYYCPIEPTVVGRYGPDGQYTSGLDFGILAAGRTGHAELQEAVRRTEQLGAANFNEFRKHKLANGWVPSAISPLFES